MILRQIHGIDQHRPMTILIGRMTEFLTVELSQVVVVYWINHTKKPPFRGTPKGRLVTEAVKALKLAGSRLKELRYVGAGMEPEHEAVRKGFVHVHHHAVSSLHVAVHEHQVIGIRREG